MGEFKVDWDTMCDNTLQTPLTRIFESLGWDWDEFNPNGGNELLSDYPHAGFLASHPIDSPFLF